MTSSIAATPPRDPETTVRETGRVTVVLERPWLRDLMEDPVYAESENVGSAVPAVDVVHAAIAAAARTVPNHRSYSQPAVNAAAPMTLAFSMDGHAQPYWEKPTRGDVTKRAGLMLMQNLSQTLRVSVH